MKDGNGNLTNVTLFESYLSKYLIEHPEFFEPVYQKILSALDNINKLNQSNQAYDRMLFSLNSIIKEDFPDFISLVKLKEQFSLFSTHLYCKLFCDYFLKTDKIKIINDAQKTVDTTPLCTHSLFKNKSDSKLLLSNLRTRELFDSRNRGVTALPETDEITLTRKLGITSIEHIPEDLENYFTERYEPSQFLYKPNRNSNVGKWMSQYNFPIISGASGSACDYLSLLTPLTSFDDQEIKSLLVALAAILVAKGHHSYFEVMILLDRFGYKFQNTENLYSFYEQTLPEKIIQSESYQDFKHSVNGAALLAGIHPNDQCECKELPEVFIGCGRVVSCNSSV